MYCACLHQVDAPECDWSVNAAMRRWMYVTFFKCLAIHFHVRCEFTHITPTHHGNDKEPCKFSRENIIIVSCSIPGKKERAPSGSAHPPTSSWCWVTCDLDVDANVDEPACDWSVKAVVMQWIHVYIFFPLYCRACPHQVWVHSHCPPRQHGDVKEPI